MNIDIKLCDISDLGGICKLEQQNFSPPWSEDSITRALSDPLFKFYGAFCGEKLVGFVNAMCLSGELTVNSIAVEEGFRRQGVGRRLLEAALCGFGEAESAFLEVRESNTAALALYEAEGFRKIAVRKGYYESPAENAVIMQKDLDGGN